jgi:hypothetical protein
MADTKYISFPHGLGDCANFILVLRMYRALGFDLGATCEKNKQPFFTAAKIPTVSPGVVTAQEHPWWEPAGLSHVTADNVLAQNKVRQNFKGSPLPPVQFTKEDLWQKLAAQRDPDMFNLYRDRVAATIDELPKPLLLVHAHGNTSAGQKDLPANFAADVSSLFLSETRGSVIFLDWDNRVSWVHSSRARHITYHYGGALSTPESLMGLMASADILLGIDSGPLHLAGLIDLPTVGVWSDHHPLRYAVSRENALHILTKPNIANMWAAPDFNAVDQIKLTPQYIFDALKLMLSPREFGLSRGADVQLQLMLKKCYGGIVKNTKHVPSVVVDRHISFSLIFDYLLQLNRPPKIVETGCIRADNDWAGAGYSTFLFGLFAHRLGGNLLSIDLSSASVNYAARVCATLPSVTMLCSDSVKAISELSGPVDLFYLDSMDANIPGHEEHGLNEAKQSVQKISNDGLIVFDDTVKDGSRFLGKGALAVPWLLDNGWEIIFMGHQIVLKRA